MFNGNNLNFELRPRTGLCGLAPDLVMFNTQPSWSKKGGTKTKFPLYNKVEEMGKPGRISVTGIFFGEETRCIILMSPKNIPESITKIKTDGIC